MHDERAHRAHDLGYLDRLIYPWWICLWWRLIGRRP